MTYLLRYDILQQYVTYLLRYDKLYQYVTYLPHVGQLAPLGCFLFADLFRYHNDVMCVELLKRKDIFAPFLQIYYYYLFRTQAASTNSMKQGP